MQQNSKPARIPSYWFGWYPKQMPTEFYVLVYREVRKQRVRKSNKPRVMQIMRQIDICHRNATHNMTLIKESNMSDLTKTVVDSQLNEFGIETKKPVESTPVEITKPHSEGQLDLEIPSFLDRRKTTVKEPKKFKRDTRNIDWKPTPVVQTVYCKALESRLHEVKDSIVHESETANAWVPDQSLDLLAKTMHEQLGNMLEHAGFVYSGGVHAEHFRNLIKEFVF